MENYRAVCPGKGSVPTGPVGRLSPQRLTHLTYHSAPSIRSVQDRPPDRFEPRRPGVEDAGNDLKRPSAVLRSWRRKEKKRLPCGNRGGQQARSFHEAFAERLCKDARDSTKALGPSLVMQPRRAILVHQGSDPTLPYQALGGPRERQTFRRVCPAGPLGDGRRSRPRPDR